MQSLIEKVQALDDSFKEHHYVIADQAEKEAVKTEQDMLDEHKDRIFLYTSRFCRLLESSKPTMAPHSREGPYTAFMQTDV